MSTIKATLALAAFAALAASTGIARAAEGNGDPGAFHTSLSTTRVGPQPDNGYGTDEVGPAMTGIKLGTALPEVGSEEGLQPPNAWSSAPEAGGVWAAHPAQPAHHS